MRPDSLLTFAQNLQSWCGLATAATAWTLATAPPCRRPSPRARRTRAASLSWCTLGWAPTAATAPMAVAVVVVVVVVVVDGREEEGGGGGGASLSSAALEELAAALAAAVAWCPM